MATAETTQMLLDVARGTPGAADRLAPVIFEELRVIAAKQLQGFKSGFSLQSTELADAAFLHLINQRQVNWQSRVHFLAVASTVIRRLLVDHARLRAAQKRGKGWQRTTLHHVSDKSGPDRTDLLALDDALESLRRLDERQAKVVELRYFGGLTVEETAEVLGISPRSVKGDWALARAWLQQRLEA